MPPPSITNIINVIAPISQFLAANDINQKGLYWGGIDRRLPRKLYMIRKNCQWLFNLDPADATLIDTSNYLYALCGRYKFIAQNITGSGGSVSPVTPATGELPDTLDFIVDATSTPVLSGETTVTFSQFIGYDVDFKRGGQPQYTTNPGDGSSYYSWNRVTGVFTIFPAANIGEPFRIEPRGGFATDSTIPSEQREPVFAIVGTTPGAPTAGTSIWTNNNFANAYVVLYLNGRPVAMANTGMGTPYLTHSFNSTTITISNYTWATNDELMAILITP